jgi:hypothetical protein
VGGDAHEDVGQVFPPVDLRGPATRDHRKYPAAS